MGRHSRRRRRRTAIAALGGTLIIGGSAAVGVALATQVHAPQPTAAQRGTTVSPPPALSMSMLAPTATVLARAIDRARAEMTPAVLPRSVPTWLSIPAIGVDSRLGEVGRTATGTIAVPPLYARPSTAAWYRFSPTPGSLGPAVIVGHVDNYLGPAIFFRLGALRPGDRIDVGRKDGTVAVFRVDGVRRYTKTAFPSAGVYGSTHSAALRLITCGGPFDTATRHYLDSVVVYASLVGEHRGSPLHKTSWAAPTSPSHRRPGRQSGGRRHDSGQSGLVHAHR